MMKLHVVCPKPDGEFSYYSMHLDHRLIKNTSLAALGGCDVELITGQTIHVNEPKYTVDNMRLAQRLLQPRVCTDEC